MSKELFMAAHEELIGEYLEEHPDATDSQAYEATADFAHDRMIDRIAAIVDYHRMQAKDRLLIQE